MLSSISEFAIRKSLEFLGKLEISGNSVVSHYTSVGALHGILKNLSLRASHVFYMNDPADSVDFYDSVIKLIHDNFYNVFLVGKTRKLEEEIGGNYLPFLSGIRENNRSFGINSNSEVINDWMFEIYSEMIKRRYSISRGVNSSVNDVYAVSFVRDSSRDMVGHWMSYGKDGFGVRVDLSVEKFMLGVRQYFESIISADDMSGVSIHLASCLYQNTDEINARASRFLNELISILSNEFIPIVDDQIIYNITRSVMEISSFIKHASYENEDECRLIVSNLSPVYGEVGYNISGSLVQPYRLVGLNWDSIEKIVCGPRSDPRAEYGIAHLAENLRYNYVQEVGHLIQNGLDEYYQSEWKRFVPPSKEIKVTRSLVKYAGKEN